VKKRVLSVILSLSLITPSYASIQSFIENNIGGSMQVTNSGYYKTQVGGYYTLGGVRIRWGDMGAVYPFHAQAPKMNVGCNGVDITWGGFGYLNFNYLVNKLKKITSVAPAFAFYTAITTLCQQCATIMDNLEKIADQINSLNFDACKVLKGMQGAIHNYLVKSGYTDNPINARAKEIADGLGTISTYLSQVQKFLSLEGLEGAKNQLGYGSLLKKALNKYASPLSSDKEFLALMRNLIGDLYGYTNYSKNKDNTDNTETRVLYAVKPQIDPEKFIKFLKTGGSIQGIDLKDHTIDEGKIYLAPKPNFINITLPNNWGLVSYYKQRIEDIIGKIKLKQELTNDEINFINSSPFPIYKIANIQATLGDDGVLDQVAEYMAYLSIRSLIRYYVNNLKKAVSGLQNNPDYWATLSPDEKNYFLKGGFEKRFQAIDNKLDNIIKNYNISLKTKINFLNYLQKLQAKMIERSPIWRANSF